MQSQVFIGESIIPNDFLIAYSNCLKIVDFKGDIKSQKTIDNCKVQDLRQFKDGLYSYFIMPSESVFKGFSHSTGFTEYGELTIADENLKPIRSHIRLKPFGSLKQTELLVQYHAHLVLDVNHYFLLGHSTVVHNDIAIANCIIQEQLNGKVIWQFETKDYPELYEYSFFHKQPVRNKPADYAHMNSIALADGGKSVLISLRNIGIIKVDYATKNMIWILGKNYTNLDLNNIISLDDVFKFQHDIRIIGPDTFSIYNNKYTIQNRSRDLADPSSVCEITIKDNKLINYKELFTECHAGAMGSANKVAENVYDIAYGFPIGIKEIFRSAKFEEKNLATDEVYVSGLLGGLYNLNRGL